MGRTRMSSLLPDISPTSDTVPTTVINTVGHTFIPLGAFASIVGYLPVIGGLIVTLLGAVFYSIQIYESRTFQHWRTNHIMKSKARRLAKLRAKEKVLVAKIEAVEKIKAARSEARMLVDSATADAAKIVAQAPATIASKQNPTI